ncbi:GNAT family N-acetyltransferase [soil metagenome]
MRTRRYDPADASAVLALNQGALEAVTPLDPTGLDRLVGQAAEVVVAEDDTVDGATVAGFAVVLAPGSPYESRNYAWFGERYDDFRYLDRVVVAPTHRRRGVGTLLYDHLERAARTASRMTLEVYSRPPNTGSLAFHAARGYVERGQLDQRNGKTCAMLAKELL